MMLALKSGPLFPSPCGDLVGKVIRETVEAVAIVKVSVPLRGFGGESFKGASIDWHRPHEMFPSPCGDLVGKENRVTRTT